MSAARHHVGLLGYIGAAVGYLFYSCGQVMRTGEVESRHPPFLSMWTYMFPCVYFDVVCSCYHCVTCNCVPPFMCSCWASCFTFSFCVLVRQWMFLPPCLMFLSVTLCSCLSHFGLVQPRVYLSFTIWFLLSSLTVLSQVSFPISFHIILFDRPCGNQLPLPVSYSLCVWDSYCLISPVIMPWSFSLKWATFLVNTVHSSLLATAFSSTYISGNFD